MKESRCYAFVWLVFRYVLGPALLTPFFLFAPLYLIWDGFMFYWFQGRFIQTPAKHKEKVRRVMEQVRAWNAGGRKAPMCTARPAWTTPTIHSLDKSDLCRIDLQDLDSVISIDTTNRVVTVEPGLMIGRLTSILNPRGWTIPVVPEIEALTIGGLIVGAGLESSSTVWGTPASAAVEYEVVVSSGEVLTCSAEENADLFHSIPWSHCTLGFLTAVKFPLLPAKKYVRLEYHVPETDAEFQALLDSREHEFVEGMSFGRHKFVVTHGDLADSADPRQGSVNSLTRWYQRFFYQHARGFLGRRNKKGPVAVEYIPLRAYYHRHTRGYFWGMHLLFPPFCSRLFLFFFGWAFPLIDLRIVKAMVLPFTRCGLYGNVWRFANVLQDYAVPIKNLRETLDLLEEQLGLYPLWFCPCKIFRRPGMMHSQDPNNDVMYVDIGIYGNVSKKARAAFHPVDTLRTLERFVIERHGYQGTYADMFLSREEFRTMFDMSLYDEVRVKYGAVGAFPEVYDKISKDARKIEITV